MFIRYRRLSGLNPVCYKWAGICRGMSTAGQNGKKSDTFFSKVVTFYTKHKQFLTKFFFAASCVQIYLIKVLQDNIVKLKSFDNSLMEEIRLWKEVESMNIDLFESDKVSSDYDVKLSKLESAIDAAIKVNKLNAFLFEQLLKEGIAPKTMPYVVVKRKGLEE